MRAAAVRITFYAILLICGAQTGAAVAGEEIDPVGTVTSIISTITSQTTVASDLTGQTTVVSDMSGGATGEGAGSGLIGSVETAVSAGAGGSSSTSDGDSGTADSSRTGRTSADGGSRANGSARTRFDRLPHRYEVLLERIEFGHRLHASMARLRALLASASPDLRARILRLIRAEIRRLERDGLTDRQRAAVRRLRRLRSVLVRPLPPSTPAATASLGRLAGAGFTPATAGGVAGTSAAGAGSAARPSTSDRPGAGLGGPEIPLPTPAPPLDGLNWLWVFLSILAGALAALALAAIALVFSARWARGQG